MKKQFFFPVILLILLTVASVMAEDSGTSITVYNQNIAVVRQARILDLTKGSQWYSYDGVAQLIDPTSVHLKGKGLEVLEQNYEYDLVGTRELMMRYLGQTVDIQLENDLIRGKLLSAERDVILEKDDGTVQIISMDKVISASFPKLPEGLVIKPTLRWMLNSGKAGKTETELSYITGGMSWEASYVATLDKDDKNLNLAAWVQINNNSGATYKDAELKLIAGDVQVSNQRHPRRSMENVVDFYATDGKAAGFQEESFFEYHLYRLPRPTTLLDKQEKQISLFDPADSPVKKIYKYSAQQNNKKVRITFEFKNSKSNGLGMPLPKGKVRVYKEASDGILEFVGEDALDHTPEDEIIRLSTGSAFDIVGEKVNLDQKRVGRTGRDEYYEVTIRNHKDESVEVVVEEKFWGDWSILAESEKGDKKNANTYEWLLKVPAKGEKKITYSVRMQ